MDFVMIYFTGTRARETLKNFEACPSTKFKKIFCRIFKIVFEIHVKLCWISSVISAWSEYHLNSCEIIVVI